MTTNATDEGIAEAASAEPHVYTVLCRSRASAIFSPGERLLVDYKTASGMMVAIVFSTRFEEKGFEVKVPTVLVAEATGVASDLTAAVGTFTNAARGAAGVLTVSANAWMGDLEAEIAYESTPGLRERDFFQEYLPDEPLTVVPGRRVNPAASAALIDAVGSSPHRARLVRAVGQYGQALANWSLGTETMALAHLYMGMEALKPVAIARYLKGSGLDIETVAAQWGYRKGGGSQTTSQFAEAECRRRLLFRGDDECHRLSKRASDSLEHGFADFGEIIHTARRTVVITAEYLRLAILENSEVGPEHQRQLLAPEFTGPRGPLRLVKYFRGRLIADGTPWSREPSGHPRLNWRPAVIRRVFLDASGKYSWSPEESVTAILGDGAQLRPQSLEVWDGSTLRDQPPPPIGPSK